MPSLAVAADVSAVAQIDVEMQQNGSWSAVAVWADLQLFGGITFSTAGGCTYDKLELVDLGECHCWLVNARPCMVGSCTDAGSVRLATRAEMDAANKCVLALDVHWQ
jgi:hypothetical protein